ncbi:MAG: hypothetical protein KKB21_01035 [Nanoarchaeota archaeon]|nr:hypothetical protein [Nanoarchaeota archaeon]MBU4086140.1 hypothetical protein [Nanoarchaeota archaeon]
MKTFILKNIKKVYENKSLFEKKLSIKITIDGRRLTMNGNEFNEFIARSVFDAIEMGFPIETALLLKEEDHILEKIEIKNLTRRSNLREVRARVIGAEGRTKALIEELSDCQISLHENEVGVIGEAESIRTCLRAIAMLIQGSKQSSVYAYLEKQRKILHPSDLGLKIEE